MVLVGVSVYSPSMRSLWMGVSIISAALILAVRGVSVCRPCIGFLFPECLFVVQVLGWCLVLRGGVLSYITYYNCIYSTS
jgi:hypothetical protein